jgi:hypothetical protein
LACKLFTTNCRSADVLLAASWAPRVEGANGPRMSPLQRTVRHANRSAITFGT